MQRKLTISIDDKVYKALHASIGRGHISQFLEDLARPYLFHRDLAAAYAAMAADDARERDAKAWVESGVGDGLGDSDSAW